MRTRIGPKWHVRDRAMPVTPARAVGSIVDQSVVPNGTSAMFTA